MRKQIKRNQFWTALILAFFILAFSGQDVSAQKKKTTPRKRTATTKTTQTQNVSTEIETSPQNTQQNESQKKSPNSTDSDASLEETVNWIKGVLGPNSFTNFNIGDEYRFTRIRDVKFEGCKLNYIVDILPGEISANGGAFLSSTARSRGQFIDLKNVFSRGFTVSLDKLDPLSIKIKPYFSDRSTPYLVELSTSNGQKTVTERVYPSGWIYHNIYGKKEFHDVDKDYDSTEDVAILIAKDEEFAKRLQRAFKQAIMLCGGKVDPF